MPVEVNDQTGLKVENTPVLLARVLSTLETSLSASVLHLTHPEKQNKKNRKRQEDSSGTACGANAAQK